MFKLFKKEAQKEKDPICGMIDNGKFISKYGQKFCSDHCIQQYEDKNQIARTDKADGQKSGCCH